MLLHAHPYSDMHKVPRGTWEQTLTQGPLEHGAAELSCPYATSFKRTQQTTCHGGLPSTAPAQEKDSSMHI